MGFLARLLRAQGREQDHVADVVGVSQQHHEAVDADAKPARRWQAVLEGPQVVLVDDVLDVVCTDEQLGKPAGNDLVTGVYTLPVIRAMAGAPDLQSLLGAPLDNDTMNKARDVVRSNGAIGTALGVAGEYASEAERALDNLDQNAGIDALRSLPRALVEGVPV